MVTNDTHHDRLTELIASLSGRPDAVARRALEHVGTNPATADDPLATVAGALVVLRRNDRTVFSAPAT